jgi:3'(2'), 5'-bisphosphate nucleotidase
LEPAVFKTGNPDELENFRPVDALELCGILGHTVFLMPGFIPAFSIRFACKLRYNHSMSLFRFGTVSVSTNAMNHGTAMSPELTKVMQLAEQAGEILKKYHGTIFDVQYKRDKFDPVTIADRESDDLLRKGISTAFPNDEILSEENPLQPSSYEGRVWMVDPLDDTKGFVAGRDTPGVMIGLCEKGKPILGVVYLPFRHEWYYGEVGKGAFRIRNGVTQQLRVRFTTEISESVLVERNMVPGDIRPLDNAIDQLGFKSSLPEGCLGNEIGLIAAGEADALILTTTKASKWDTLAAQTILTEAGGVICDIDGNALDYTKPDSSWDRYVVAACTPELLQRMLSKLREFNDATPTF